MESRQSWKKEPVTHHDGLEHGPHGEIHRMEKLDAARPGSRDSSRENSGKGIASHRGKGSGEFSHTAERNTAEKPKMQHTWHTNETAGWGVTLRGAIFFHLF